jgi:hypothetical protein
MCAQISYRFSHWCFCRAGLTATDLSVIDLLKSTSDRMGVPLGGPALMMGDGGAFGWGMPRTFMCGPGDLAAGAGGMQLAAELLGGDAGGDGGNGGASSKGGVVKVRAVTTAPSERSLCRELLTAAFAVAGAPDDGRP